jgi:hypothetical protein
MQGLFSRWVLFLCVLVGACKPIERDWTSNEGTIGTSRTFDRSVSYDGQEPIDWGLSSYNDASTDAGIDANQAENDASDSCVFPSIPVGWTRVSVATNENEVDLPACSSGLVWEGSTGLAFDAASCSPCSCSFDVGFGAPQQDAPASHRNIKAGLGTCGSCSTPEACDAVPFGLTPKIHAAKLVQRIDGIDVATGINSSPIGTCMQYESSTPYVPTMYTAIPSVSVWVKPGDVTAGYCNTPTGGNASLSPATWGSFVRACEGPKDGACDVQGTRACIVSSDEAAACPSGWTDRLVGGSSAVDSRSCSSCSCGATLGSTYTTHFAFWSDQCQGAAVATVDVISVQSIPNDWTCIDLPGTSVSGRMVGPIKLQWGSCEVSGGEPIGSVVVADPRVLCCIE